MDSANNPHIRIQDIGLYVQQNLKRPCSWKASGRQVSNKGYACIRREKATTEDLPTKMMVPNPTNKKIHFEPFYMMKFRDAQGQRRFFRNGGQLKDCYK